AADKVRGPIVLTQGIQSSAQAGMKSNAVLEYVRFERPMVEHIRKSGFHPVDMHFHTNHSDAYTKVRSALTLAKKKGVGLAITDHNTLSGAVEAHRMRLEV